jgi:hypothetical protein
MANLPFPWRAEEIPANAFWFRSGSDGWDFNAQRRTEGGGWDRNKANASSPVQNEDEVGYNRPVYAIADGEVLSAWRSAPDNERPGVKDPRNTSQGGNGISNAGNHIAVLGDDGHVVLYAHMAPGTVPRELCREPDKAIMDNANNRVKDAQVEGVDKISLPAESAWVEAASRPRVKQGQLLGRVGNSGNSTGPHLHLSRKTRADVAAPFGHDRAWRSDKSDPDNWKPFNGQTVGSDDKNTVILASPLLRRGEASAGEFGELAMHFVRSRRVVTALQDENGDLKLITWGLTSSQQFQRRGDISAGRASRIAIAEPRSDIVVTALRDGDGNLRLISWRIEDNGDITRCAHAAAGAATRVALATVQEGVVVSAVRTGNGNLKLIAWAVASDGAFARRGDVDAGVISDVVITRAQPFSGVVTAVRTAGTLKLIAWRVSANGATINRGGEAEAGAISAVAMIRRGSQGQFLLTALRDSEGELRLVSWRLSGEGSIDRLGTATAGKVSEIDIAGVAGASRSAVVVCRDDGGRLRLITWELSSDGKAITRWGGALAGNATRIRIAGTSDAGRTFFVTACADSAGKLKLLNWEANL